MLYLARTLAFLPLIALLLPAASFAHPAGSDCTTQAQVSQGECEVLVAIYNALGGHNWDLGWSGNQPCTWSGVVCSAPPSAQLVTALGLGINSMFGQIPPELRNLPNLESLEIGLERFVTGPIPPEIGQLTQLRTLRLYGIDLSGSIPPEIGNLSNLEMLRLTGDFTGGFPPNLGNLNNLRSMEISPNHPSNPGLQGPIPSEFGNLASLETLILDGNTFGSPLPATIGNLTSLRIFRARDAGLIGPVPVTLGNLQDLTRLDLSRNRLSGGLPPELGIMASLEWLDLRGSNLEGPIPAQWQNFSSLLYLELDENRLSGPIPPGIGLIPTLTYIGVENNRLDGTLLATLLGDPTQQVSMHLTGNDFSGDVPPEWVLNGYFNSLRVSWNCLTVTDPAARALLDLKDPGWEATQCVRIFADGFDIGHPTRWDITVEGP